MSLRPAIAPQRVRAHCGCWFFRMKPMWPAPPYLRPDEVEQFRYIRCKGHELAELTDVLSAKPTEEEAAPFRVHRG